MNTDIRLAVGFWQHPKTRRLARHLGLEGVRSLQILWLWAAQYRPDGRLTGMDWEDVELAADWQGPERQFFEACLGVWIDALPCGMPGPAAGSETGTSGAGSASGADFAAGCGASGVPGAGFAGVNSTASMAGANGAAGAAGSRASGRADAAGMALSGFSGVPGVADAAGNSAGGASGLAAGASGFSGAAAHPLYVLHDWESHNPWQSEALLRSEKAQRAARARWGARGGAADGSPVQPMPVSGPVCVPVSGPDGRQHGPTDEPNGRAGQDGQDGHQQAGAQAWPEASATAVARGMDGAARNSEACGAPAMREAAGTTGAPAGADLCGVTARATDTPAGICDDTGTTDVPAGASGASLCGVTAGTTSVPAMREAVRNPELCGAPAMREAAGTTGAPAGTCDDTGTTDVPAGTCGADLCGVAARTAGVTDCQPAVHGDEQAGAGESGASADARKMPGHGLSNAPLLSSPLPAFPLQGGEGCVPDAGPADGFPIPDRTAGTACGTDCQPGGQGSATVPASSCPDSGAVRPASLSGGCNQPAGSPSDQPCGQSGGSAVASAASQPAPVQPAGASAGMPAGQGQTAGSSSVQPCGSACGTDCQPAGLPGGAPAGLPDGASAGPKRLDCPGRGHPQWAAFQMCWQVYPVHQGREEAWCEWMRLWGNRTLAEPWVIRDAILRMAAEDTRWRRGKVPKMARWLAGKGWDDEPFVERRSLPDSPRRGRADGRGGMPEGMQAGGQVPCRSGGAAEGGGGVKGAAAEGGGGSLPAVCGNGVNGNRMQNIGIFCGSGGNGMPDGRAYGAVMGLRATTVAQQQIQNNDLLARMLLQAGGRNAQS